MTIFFNDSQESGNIRKILKKIFVTLSCIKYSAMELFVSHLDSIITIFTIVMK